MFAYKTAYAVADEIIRKLSGSCQKAEVVGSLRRGKSYVNDVDIIVIPAFSLTPDHTLFGDLIRQNLLDIRLSNLCTGVHMTLQTNGPKIKRLFKKCNGRTMPIDIYIADEQTWWTLKLIRTGSRNHNVTLASRAIRKHMVLKADGTGLLTAGGDVISIDSEEAVFQHLGMPYRRPEERE